jgi:hypothetical protein
MGDDDESGLLFTPILKRIFILMAFIAVVPVALWGITTFVRSYVEQPKPPMFRRIAVTAESPAPKIADRDSAAAIQATPPEQEAQASPDVRGPSDETQARPPAMSRSLTARLSDSGGGSPLAASLPQPVAAPTTLAVSAAGAAPAPSVAVAESSGNSMQPGMAPAPEMTTGTTTPVADDATLAPDPINGPVPLPRQRPHSFAVAQLGLIPIPRPRPDAAAPAAASAPENPFGWMRNIFQPQNSTPGPASNPAQNGE